MMNLASLDTVNSLSDDSLRCVGTFIQKHAVVIHPQLVHAAGYDWIFYMLFGLLFLIAFIRFFYPAAAKTVFFWFSGAGFRNNDNGAGKQGLLVSSFLMLNFIVSITLFIVVIQMRTGVSLADISSSSRFWLVAAGGVAGFFLYDQLSAFLTGFIFDTGRQSSLQMKNTATWAYISGLFLTPLLLIYFYSDADFVFDIMAGGLLILLLFKWFQTAKIGLSTRNFNALHLFLYLCAVEIIPLFLLVKIYLV
jgi:hypothetical protein